MDIKVEGLNLIVGNLYCLLEKNDDKEDLPYSLLKFGAIQWRKRVFGRFKKQIEEGVSSKVRNLFKLLKKEMALMMIQDQSENDGLEDEKQKVQEKKRKIKA
mmetsp:Transcript_39896/g.29433  ORF Transcript_39896/g.29433 Transcript_39896/m.29433 type:complete len:102 (-) Transcript_39896:1279-1584(-)|eukprot:CAMPEP_0202969182 /NCGR_PEP_ID=MMETSP1396-20130829/14816_1 /ASSEMBLY_ACC=CAM_ASM_000872 /TAXON_ID= /ORGANISM="Pseudokeronopsis sp., Strain Brazil" /LENGTH=101 /DNA_ID=CAMNT_0049696415 /DNA_START=199 /DNA_END=504 /DNA_ORIENTATION=-